MGPWAFGDRHLRKLGFVGVATEGQDTPCARIHSNLTKVPSPEAWIKLGGSKKQLSLFVLDGHNLRLWRHCADENRRLSVIPGLFMILYMFNILQCLQCWQTSGTLWIQSSTLNPAFNASDAVASTSTHRSCTSHWGWDTDWAGYAALGALHVCTSKRNCAIHWHFETSWKIKETLACFGK